MAHAITIPFHAFKLQFQSDTTFLSPLNDKNAIRIDQSFEIVAGKYAEIIQRKLLNQGKTRQLLAEYQKGEFQKETLQVPFPKASNGYSHPAFSLTFDYFYTDNGDGTHGIVPTLGIEAFADSPEKIEKNLQEAIRIEFTRRKRLNALQQVVATIWYEGVELLRTDMQLRALSPAEVEAAEKEDARKLLPQAAQKLQFYRQIAYGVEENLEQLAKALKNRYNQNVILVGPSGVGKTALVWEAVRRQHELKFKGEIWETTASKLIKELTADTGAWENNMALFCQELIGSDNILFIRNLMELFEVGQYSGSDVSLADFLRNYISRGEVVLISECTEEELARIELRSSNFLSFFQILRIQEPSQNLEDIILKKVNDIASGRRVSISAEAIREVIRLHRRFVPYAGMPGRPIRFLESMLLNKKIEKDQSTTVTRSEVIEHFCEETGMPVFMVDPSIKMDTTKVRAEFHSSVYGQDNAVNSIVDVLAAVKAALTRTSKPIASFLFVGPTGVGKTELAKVLAQFMFSSRQRMIRFDMSEYSDPVTVMRLIGSDYFSDGLLTSAVRREPFCVLLFDEIEKAHPSFYDLLLQMLGEGRLTDNQGKLVNFCSTIIIMTSNIGASALQNSRIGWNSEVEAREVTDHFMHAVQKHFRPELFNRIDQVIPFEPLDRFTIRFVVEREIKLIRQREGIRYRRLDLNIPEEVLDFIGKRGYHDRYGARYLQRFIRQELITPLARALNAYDPEDQLSVTVKIVEDQLKMEIIEDPLGLDLLLEELEKINQSNHASHLRRQIHRLRDGDAYHQLMSQLDDLERARKYKDFWKNTAQVQRYNDLLQIREKERTLSEAIEASELELSLSSLGFTTYKQTFYQKVEAWEKEFDKLKRRACSALSPETNVCFFAIYGTKLKPIVDFYLDIFKKKKWTFTAQSVWFRESFYNEQIERRSLDKDGKEVTSWEARAEYIEQSCKPDEEEDWHRQSPEADDRLYGIKFTLFGENVYLYLKDENGIHRWHLSDQFDELYSVWTNTSVFAKPRNIHRMEFYQSGKLRRIYKPPIITDDVYNINRELGKMQLSELILEELEDRFNRNLNAVLLY